MICKCYKISTWYFEIYHNDCPPTEMLVCGKCLVYNNPRITMIHAKMQSRYPIPGVYLFMADVYNLRSKKECISHYYGDDFKFAGL